jgi:HK97 family phage major capsid protein
VAIKQDLNELRSIEELVSYQTTVQGEIKDLDSEFKGLPMSTEAASQFAELNDTDAEIEKRVKELQARKDIVERMAHDPKKVERAFSQFERQVEDRGTRKEADIYDLSTLHRNPFMDPEGSKDEIRDRAKRAIELARFPTMKDGTKAQAHMEHLLDDTIENQPGDAARQFLLTGGPVYRRAFWKQMVGTPLDRLEQRALSLAGSGGGFAIPFALDPSIIPTSNSVVNPARALARLVTISGANTWQGVTSPAITASYAAEGTEATDNSTTLVQPQVTVQKAQAFVPFSIEVVEDWPALESEFGRLLQDAKDDLEGVQFVTGVGTTVFPQGFVVGTTVTSAATTGLVVTAADVYALEAALPPRFRPRESFVANRGIYNKIRGIDTAGGAALWLYMAQGLVTQAPTPGNTGATLLGRGAWEASGMQATVVNATKIMVVGDFSYYLIVDRIGMTVELVPHIFGAANRFPIGQRGLYAYWRNSAKVLSASAFVAMTGTT